MNKPNLLEIKWSISKPRKRGLKMGKLPGNELGINPAENERRKSRIN